MQSNSTLKELKGVTMNAKIESVDYESLSLKVREFLLSKELGLAVETPIVWNSKAKTRSLDIVRKDPDAKPRKYLFGLITLKPRQEFLGTIWFSNKAGTNKYYWVFEVYNHEHVDLAKQLAGEMASNFNTKITLLLVRGQPSLESYELIRYYGV